MMHGTYNVILKTNICINYGFQTGKPNGYFLPSVTRKKRWKDPDVFLEIFVPCVVGTVIILRSVRPRKQGLIPGRGKRVFPSVQTCFRVHPVSCTMDTGGRFLGDKAVGARN